MAPLKRSKTAPGNMITRKRGVRVTDRLILKTLNRWEAEKKGNIEYGKNMYFIDNDDYRLGIGHVAEEVNYIRKCLEKPSKKYFGASQWDIRTEPTLDFLHLREKYDKVHIPIEGGETLEKFDGKFEKSDFDEHSNWERIKEMMEFIAEEKAYMAAAAEEAEIEEMTAAAEEAELAEWAEQESCFLTE